MIVDEAELAKATDALGIELSFATFSAYVKKRAPDEEWGCMELGLKLMQIALTSEFGHAKGATIDGHIILVAKGEGKLVFSIARGAASRPFDGTWKITPRWYSDPERNRPTIENWLRDRKRKTDSLTIPIVRAHVPPRGGEDLLAAVCADPEDLAARLVYADWLVEQGDVRGELIHVQCEAIDAKGKRLKELERRANELEHEHYRALFDPIDRFVRRARIHRGLIEEIEIFGEQLLEHGETLVARHPITEMTVFVKSAKQLAQIAALPWIGKIAAATYVGRAKKRDERSGATLNLSATCGTTIFARTKTLVFDHVEDDPAAWIAMFEGIDAPMLESIEVRCDLDCRVLVAIAHAKGMPKLAKLQVWEAAAPTEFVAAMTALAGRSGLERLSINGYFQDAVIAKGVEAIVASKSLKRLRLGFTEAGPATDRALRKAPSTLEIEER